MALPSGGRARSPPQRAGGPPGDRQDRAARAQPGSATPSSSGCESPKDSMRSPAARRSASPCSTSPLAMRSRARGSSRHAVWYVVLTLVRHAGELERTDRLGELAAFGEHLGQVRVREAKGKRGVQGRSGVGFRLRQVAAAERREGTERRRVGEGEGRPAPAGALEPVGVEAHGGVELVQAQRAPPPPRRTPGSSHHRAGGRRRVPAPRAPAPSRAIRLHVRAPRRPAPAGSDRRGCPRSPGRRSGRAAREPSGTGARRTAPT